MLNIIKETKERGKLFFWSLMIVLNVSFDVLYGSGYKN
jgi:hypothetical protein